MVKHKLPAKAARAAAKAHAGKGKGAAFASAAAAANSSAKPKHGGIGAANAFETLTYRSKHEVLQLGKARGKVKRPSASLSNSLAQRQASLLAELHGRERANSFTDERLREGAAAEEVDTEEQLLRRFQRERQKRLASSSRFSMQDEDDTMLTHGGQALSAETRRNYSREEHEQPDEEEEEGAEAEAEPGAEGEDAQGEGEGRARSKHEVMHEVMMKSKMYRAERAVRSEEQANLQSNLDAEFDAIRSQMQFVSNADRERERKAARDAERAATMMGKKGGKGGEQEEDSTPMDPTDEFVLEARQLGLDLRARATDRLKSEEELVAAEKKRLERLERLRLKRMRGEEVRESEEDEDDDDQTSSRKRRRQKEKAASSAARRPTDDDLDENFVLTGRAAQEGRDETDLLSDEEEQQADMQADDDEEEDEDEEEESEEEEEDEDEDDEEEGADEEAEEADSEVKPLKAVFIGDSSKKSDDKKASSTDSDGFKTIFIGKSSSAAASAAKVSSSNATSAASAAASKDDDSSVPFTFPMPTTYKDLRATLAPYPHDKHALIIQRIRTCHHISLAPENRQKTERFHSLLLTHFRRLVSDYTSKLASDSAHRPPVSELLQRLDDVGAHIADLSLVQSLNQAIGRNFRTALQKMREEAFSAEDPAGMPGLRPDHLLFLKLVATVFPSSDFRHNVVTPSLLLQCELLLRAPVVGPSELVRGLFLCAGMLHALHDSKRLAPELVAFLHAALVHGVGVAGDPEAGSRGAAKSGKKASAAAAEGDAQQNKAEVFSTTPSPARLHNSLQPRTVNFVASEQLALWKPLFESKKAAKGQTNGGDDESSTQIPLQWLFLSSSAPEFTGSNARSFRLTLYTTLLQLVHQAAQLYHTSAPSYAELFTPLLDSLGLVLQRQKDGVYASLPPTAQTYTSHLHSFLSSSILHSISLRTPLEASLAPLALKSHAPLFQEGYNPTKDYDPVKERAQIKELGKKLKREKKGAMRELRRDTAVVQQQQRAVQAAYAAEREAKRKEVWAQMEEQQRDTNILQRAGKKKEKKEGKKKK